MSETTSAASTKPRTIRPTSRAAKKSTTSSKRSAPKAVALAKPKTGKKRGPKLGSGPKRNFIDSQPADATIDQIVAAAAKAGLRISANYVYKLRGKPGPKAPVSTRKGTAAKAPVSTKPAPKSQVPAESGSIDRTLVQLVLQHGIERVRTVLDQIEARMVKLLASA